MRLKSERILLRKMEEKDIEYYNKWSNDFDVVENTYLNLDAMSIDDTKQFFHRISTSTNAKTFIIESITDSTPIGITSLISIDSYNRNAEFIIDIGDKSFWGKGIGREATTMILDYAFKELNLHRIYLRVFTFNERAINLYRTIGFIEEGVAREALFRFGKWHGIVSMSILQEEYLRKVLSKA
ncbi:GNAT family N-acetyltransferase [Vallitalea pronyensis]|uniref:GNAT family N-acetyltransferase n=1 Tax=Vallitalea pronyensis TaxID=1348613 RepID=A0A8J8SFJ9_9FIRM|nr:GNAT family protein [Vallitalea pronyensis]QUI21671.1 GNAT family N-acetyltransferase [Vallitalea pronyensis]